MLGWSRERIVVIDEDQGQSGAVPQSRVGFGGMVTAVARAEGGIVMSFELSRLSRNDLDWHHMVYLCRWTDTLIGDEQGVYDPSSSSDRMVLGIRGQVSELERDGIVHRMVEARWNKARRGESFTIPPAGYEAEELGQLGLSSDEAVQATVRRVFEKFDELGAARQVFPLVAGGGAELSCAQDRPAHASDRLGPRHVSLGPRDAEPPHLRRRLRVRSKRDPARDRSTDPQARRASRSCAPPWSNGRS